MNQQQRGKQAGLVAAACGSLLLGLPLIPRAVQAQITPNPAGSTICPPTSSSQTAPGYGSGPTQTGPSPGATERLTQQPTRVLQPPLPETRQAPIARVLPTGQQLNVKLINRTGTSVNYEAIGDTNFRTLPPNTATTLQRLKLPTTLTLDRPDGGLITLNTRSMPGMLEVTLYPTSNFDLDKSVIRVQPTGLVFSN